EREGGKGAEMGRTGRGAPLKDERIRDLAAGWGEKLVPAEYASRRTPPADFPLPLRIAPSLRLRSWLGFFLKLKMVRCIMGQPTTTSILRSGRSPRLLALPSFISLCSTKTYS